MLGITFNYKSSNFDTNKDLLLNGLSNSTVTVRTDKKMKQKRGDGACLSIVTEPVDNSYSVSLFKRRRTDDNTSVPFEYKYAGCVPRALFRLGRRAQMLDSNIRLPVL